MAGRPVLQALRDVERLSPRVVRVLGLNPSPYTLQGTNTYVVGTGSARALIDAGEGGRPHYCANLRTALGPAARISHILLTHWHHDHVGGVADVLAMPEAKGARVMKLPRPPELAGPDVRSEMGALADGDVVSVEGATLRVVATPGHTADHVAFVLDEESAVFAGDCILGQGTAVRLQWSYCGRSLCHPFHSFT